MQDGFIDPRGVGRLYDLSRFSNRQEPSRFGLGAHYHALGYIENGFAVCRDCVHEFKDCHTCKGFKGREVGEYEKDRCIVKVLDERKTVFGTAWYQLHHATIRLGIKRFQSVTWFGALGYRNLRGCEVEG